jgi:hypothetical protein
VWAINLQFKVCYSSPFFVNSTFASDVINVLFPSLPRNLKEVAMFELASVVYHQNWLRDTLPSNHILFELTSFCETSLISSLLQHIECRTSKPCDPL